MDGSQSTFARLRALQPAQHQWMPQCMPQWMPQWMFSICLGLFYVTIGLQAVPAADPEIGFKMPDGLTTFEVEAAAQPLQAPGNLNPLPRLMRVQPRVIQANRSPIVAVLTQPSTEQSANASARSRSVVPQPVTTVSASDSAGQHKLPPTIEEALATRGSVTFRKTPLSEVVFLLSDLWQINIVAGDNVTGEVSGAFHDAPLGEVLTAVLSSSGYSYRKTGSSLIVLSTDQVGADDANFIVKTLSIPLRLQEGEQVLEAVRMMLSDRGKINRIGSSMILVVDSRERIEQVETFFQEFDGHGEIDGRAIHDEQTVSTGASVNGYSTASSRIAYFSPQFTEAEAMAEPLQAALGDSVIVAVFPEENRIMVKGSAQDLEVATAAIEQLDRARPQVRITATIYDVSLKEVERLGINWNFSPHSGGTALTDIADAESIRFRNLISASTNLVTDSSAAGAGNLAISTLNETINVDALLQALHNNGEAKLLADPSVTVGDRRQASIRIVKKIPIIAAQPVDNSGVVFSQVQFEEAGVILNVLPRISRDGTIEMNVKPEYSVVADFIQNNPVIDSRTAETTVRVANGQTFVIGGLRQKSVIETVRGVPFLKDIKFIGKLFRSHDTEIQESELIVFIKPELITPYYGGMAREREASRVVNKELDAIPHAQTCPMTPCCKDPHCPNHHPKIKVNGGSEALRWSDFEEYSTQEISGAPIQHFEITEPETRGLESSTEQPISQPIERMEQSEVPQVPVRSGTDFPPVHVDPRVY